ncbi:MAG: gliding motility-associated ABC transporter permease subunit GldF [Bacteroidota bacterium]|nr:gliding motility-associated ABC transporter permease subunit GldF [Bacteroidota bacterium]
MISIAKKEFYQFFSSLTGYITIILFLLVNALYLFVLKDSNVFDYGYATLASFFDLAPWVFIFLLPALGMRSFADEFKSGTFETLKTSPLTKWQIVFGKYLAIIAVIIIALIPTVLYVITIQSLSTGGIDTGAITGSYIGLFLLASVFAAITTWCSSLTSNAVIAFLLSSFACIILYFGFSAISKLPVFTGNADYYIEMLGIDFHYQSISRGVLDTRDIIYFFSVIFIFLFATQKNLHKK